MLEAWGRVPTATPLAGPQATEEPRGMILPIRV